MLPLADIAKIVREAKAGGARIVTTNGCFDILHVGHVRYLEEAKRHGDMLLVGINSDSSVRALKGPSRPVNPAHERAELIAALTPVDAVFIFEETTPKKWLAKIRPHVHVKGGDRKPHEIIERDVVEKHGGRIVLAGHVKGRSTTQLLERARAKS